MVGRSRLIEPAPWRHFRPARQTPLVAGATPALSPTGGPGFVFVKLKAHQEQPLFEPGTATFPNRVCGFPALVKRPRSGKFFPFTLVFERGIPEKAGGGVVWMVALMFF